MKAWVIKEGKKYWDGDVYGVLRWAMFFKTRQAAKAEITAEGLTPGTPQRVRIEEV